MPEIILHHYGLSPHSEKIRLALGLKQLSWRSVEVPVLTPRPLLSRALGDFRRIPVLQIGADFYCDTLLICDVIEKARPLPSLYACAEPAMIKAICWWIERSSFFNALGLTLGGMGGRVPDDLVRERSQFFGFDLDPGKLAPERTTYAQGLNAHVSWIEEILSDGRQFILGEHPSAADLAAYHPIWFARQNGGPEIQAILPALATSPWYERISALGHGHPSALPGETALEIAAEASPQDVDEWSSEATLLGFRPGQRVRISANDYGKDPVTGTLKAWTAHEIVIRREDWALDLVNLHFPRVGFVVSPAAE